METPNENSIPQNAFSYVNQQQGTSTVQPTSTRRINFKTKTAEQLPGNLLQFGFFVGQDVRVMEYNSSTIVEAKVKWMGTINSVLYFGLQSDIPQSRKNVYYQAYVEREGGNNGRQDWLIKPEYVRPSHRAFIRVDPTNFGFFAQQILKVNVSGEIGIVKWKGRIDGVQFFGLEIMNRFVVSCPIVNKYPELLHLFEHTNDLPIMFVTHSQFEYHRGELFVSPPLVFDSEESDANIANHLEQLRQLVYTNNDIVASTSSASNQPSENAIPECVVCQLELSAYIITPCGHFCLCAGCYHRYSNDNNLKNNCPLCRARVIFYIKVKM